MLAAALLEHVPCAAALLDGERRVVIANPAFERTFGVPAGRCCYEVFKRRAEPCERCPAEGAFLGEPAPETAEEHGFTSDGTPIVYQVQSAGVAAGGERFLLLMTTDLGPLVALRERLGQAEQLAAVGLTVAGLAHTVKNIIAGLEGGIYMVDTGIAKADPERLQNGWAMVKRYIDQVAVLVRNLLSYARPRVLERRSLDVGEALQETARLFTEKAALAEISMEVEVEPGLPPVCADAEALQACLGNLVTNALDACVWDPAADKQHRIRLVASAAPPAAVRLEVRDNGMGISDENRPKLLSALFTTKGMRGTGLGLLLTRKAVEAHGGRVWFESATGQGTTFVIELPRAEAAEPIAKAGS
jgi:signal transduction histidine kinase